MPKNLGFRAGIALLAVMFGLMYITPTLTSDLPRWWSSLLPDEKIHLGLDLQGGIHLILEVKVAKAVETHLERVVEEIKRDLRKEKIRYLELKRKGTKGVSLTLMRDMDRDKFKNIAGAHYPDFDLEDISGVEGSPSFEMVLHSRASNHVKKLAVDQAIETIRNRIDQFGVTEPDIRPQHDNRILIQLPGVKDPERAKELIGRTAQLEFKLVDSDHSVEEALRGNIPPGDEILYEIKTDPKTGRQAPIPYLLKKRTLLTGQYLTDAGVRFDNQYNRPYISISFDARGARLFDQITAANVQKHLAIVLDNRVYSAPRITERISGGRAQITGWFTDAEARDLAIVLRAGALPAPVEIMEERTVGPSLGKDSIDKGIKSMVIGGLIVIFFMMIYYGLSGVIADLALLLNIVFIGAGLSLFGATLTLPGIAGVILTIGMSVDANVLIFERIREELRLGKTPRASIEGGYSKALVTILDANITTLIVALVLFQFGTGPVRGFAVTLSIGIIASLFTAIFVTRIIFDYLYTQLNFKKVSI